MIILAHGSRGRLGTQAVPEVLDRVARGLRVLLSPDAEITGAALQFNHPDLNEAAASLISRGAGQIVVAPYFLFPGRHITEDIPQHIEKLSLDYPGTRFVLTDNLGLDESFIDLMARRITRACPGLCPASPPTVPASEIEQQSMAIIERLLPPGPDGDERTVVKRIVHTCGDPQIARLVRFSPSAVSAGVTTILRGSPIFTDVRMVATGISAQLARDYGCSIFCALDEVNPEAGQPVTRSARAMYGLGSRLDKALVAIGNAPTSLLALLDMIDHRRVAPALVVGMPVGFVQARESKAELMARDVPFITIEGTRGGSTLAAATVNALLRLAEAADSSRNMVGIKSNLSGGTR